MSVDPNRVADILRELSETVIMPNFGRLSADDVRQKTSPNDLVTRVDHEAEAFLEEALAPLLPGAGFIGEEGAAAAPEIVARLSGPGRFWVIDPLDGTRNFVKRTNEFATILALVEDGVTQMGWIYACPEAACAIAVRGGGATLRGGAIRVGRQGGGRPEGFRSLGWLPDAERKRIAGCLRKNTVTKPGHCSAYAYLKLAFGAVDFKLSSRVHPWDHAAGALMLEELGGRTAFLPALDVEAGSETGAEEGGQGEAYRPADSVDRPLLAVAPGRDWSAVAGLLGY